jgi:hypothetical protein
MHMKLRSLVAWAVLAVPLGACGMGGVSSDAGGDTFSCNFVPGQVTSSVGSSVGQIRIDMHFNHGHEVHFDNTNRTVYGGGMSKVGVSPLTTGCESRYVGEIVDLGPVCLDSVGGWPGGTTVPLTVFVGHTYMVQVLGFCMPGEPGFPSAYYAFTVEGYSGGVLTYTWIEL